MSYCIGVIPGGGSSHILPIRVCAAQQGRDFEAPDLERGIIFNKMGNKKKIVDPALSSA